MFEPAIRTLRHVSGFVWPLPAAPLAVCLAILVTVLSPLRVSAFVEERKTQVEAADKSAAAILDALDVWDPIAAQAILDSLQPGSLDAAVAIYFEARIAFQQGNYERAEQLMADLERGGQIDQETLGHFRTFVSKTYLETRDYVRTESAHFVVSHPPGPEVILAEAAVEALEQQYAALRAAFDLELTRKIRVEIVPSKQAFIDLSAIPEEAVETTGVVGLCKYNKVLVTSPRALPRGYPWLETLAHELVHYFVTKRTDGRTPVWLHEGLAKFFEQSWRPQAERDPLLNPSHETLLLRALKGDKLVPLKKMHPSFVYLDSAEEAAQAYAQVATIVEYIVKDLGKGDFGTLHRLLDEVRGGAHYEQAIARAAGAASFEQFYQGWVSYLKARPMRLVKNAEIAEIRFADSEEQLEKKEFDEIDSEKVQRFIRVGDLLKNRGRFVAAGEEYEKALAEFGANALILNKAAHAWLQAGRADQARPHLEKAREYFPEYVTIYKRLGEFYSLKQQWKDAASAFEEALEINPFDTEARRMALAVYGQLEHESAIERHRQALEILSSPRRSG